MCERIVAVGIGMNKDSKLSGDTVLTAVLSDDTVVVLDNWYSDERRKPHVAEYECIGKAVEEVKAIVHERDVKMINNWA
jgi:hypothetical protein